MVKEKQSVSLSEIERKIVRAEDARLGLENFSATLRKIVREWDEMKRQQLPQPTAQDAQK